MTGPFSANASALGYFYQTRYALLILLRAGGDDPDAEISIERFDDVAFEEVGTPLELIQTKHHIGSFKSLSDASVDLWKTLRVWSTAITCGDLQPENVRLTLVTTALAPEGSVASKLRPQFNRDVDGALEVLRSVAITSTNKDNAPSYDAFRKLTPLQQKVLLGSVHVLDASPNIVDVREQIVSELRIATRPRYLNAVIERIEGWWFSTVARHLSDGSLAPISYAQLLDMLNDIQDQFHQDNLPIDFPKPIRMEEEELPAKERVFVAQLRLTVVAEERIRKAISDYYRASQQRSKWVREALLLQEELGRYEDDLIDEWDRLFLIMKEDFGGGSTEAEMQRYGRSIFNKIDETNRPIRPRCIERYITRGSYHILANELRVGWHPEFRERLGRALSSSEVAE